MFPGDMQCLAVIAEIVAQVTQERKVRVCESSCNRGKGHEQDVKRIVPNGASLGVICMRKHLIILTKTVCPRAITPVLAVTDLFEA